MAKPTWVFSVGTYRTGSTTHYEMTRDIVVQTKNGIGIGYHTEGRLQDYDCMPKNGSMIVCKVFKFLPETSPHGERFLQQNRIKALATIRDPRDIIVSMRERGGARKKTGEKVSNFDFNKTVTVNFPIWLGQLEKWVDLGPAITLVTKFEVFTINRFAEAKRIADHLGIKVDDDTLKTIAKEYSIQAMNARKRAFMDDKSENKREDPALPAIPAVKFGTSGHWRTWLSVGESTMVETACSGFMRRFGYL